MRTFFALCTAVMAAALSLTAPVLGQGLNVDFELSQAGGGPGIGIPAITFGAAANQPGQWNRVFQTQLSVALNGLDGLASGVTLNRSGVVVHSGFNHPGTTGDHQTLMDDFWTTDNGDGAMEFVGLNGGWYEVYTYTLGVRGECRTRVEVDGALTPAVQVGGGPSPGNAFFLGLTHTRHRVFIDREATLKIRISNAGGGCVAVPGIQIKPVDPCPDVDIKSPDNFACICEGENIKGDVTIDAPGIIAFWFTEYRALSDPNWTFIDVGFSGGINIPLGFFNAAGLSQGYYFIKTTAFGGDGCFDEDTHIVFVDKQFDVLDMTTPVMDQAYGGVVCIGGILDDHCLNRFQVQWAPLPAGAPFTHVNPGTPNYFGHFPIFGYWATWDTIGQAIPDGEYRIRVQATDVCGHLASETVDMIVDNTPPEAEIISPANCETVQCGTVVPVKGTACDANLAGWVLQITGGPYNGWVTIASGNTCVIADLLGNWDTNGLPNCCYTLRLLVTDSSQLNCNGAITHQTEFMTSVNLGLKGDVDGNGVVEFADITAVLQFWGFSCP